MKEELDGTLPHTMKLIGREGSSFHAVDRNLVPARHTAKAKVARPDREWRWVQLLLLTQSIECTHLLPVHMIW